MKPAAFLIEPVRLVANETIENISFFIDEASARHEKILDISLPVVLSDQLGGIDFSGGTILGDVSAA